MPDETATETPAPAEENTPHPTVIEAWADVMDELRSVGKDGYNKQSNYIFRGIDAVMNGLGPVLRNHRVFVIPTLLKVEESEVVVGNKRTFMRNAAVEVQYAVYGPAGDKFYGSTPGSAFDSGDKAISKAMSVAYRTFLLQSLCLPTSDPEPDATTYDANGEAQRVAHEDAQQQPQINTAQAEQDAYDKARNEAWAKTEGFADNTNEIRLAHLNALLDAAYGTNVNSATTVQWESLVKWWQRAEDKLAADRADEPAPNEGDQ